MRLKSLTEVLGWIIGIRPSEPLKSSEKTGKGNEKKGEEKDPSYLWIQVEQKS